MSYADILAFSKLDAQRIEHMKKYGVPVSKEESDLNAAIEASRKAVEEQQKKHMTAEERALQEALRLSQEEENARQALARRREAKEQEDDKLKRELSFRYLTQWKELAISYLNYTGSALPRETTDQFNQCYRAVDFTGMQQAILALTLLVDTAKVAHDLKQTEEQKAKAADKQHKEICKELLGIAIERLKELSSLDARTELAGARFDALQEYCDQGKSDELSQAISKMEEKIRSAHKLMTERQQAQRLAEEKILEERRIEFKKRIARFKELTKRQIVPIPETPAERTKRVQSYLDLNMQYKHPADPIIYNMHIFNGALFIPGDEGKPKDPIDLLPNSPKKLASMQVINTYWK
jgi:hypothetical protein